MDNNFYKILETFKKLNESTFQESVASEADQLITDLVNGDADVYDVYAHPTTPIETYVSEIIHKYYEDVVIDTGMHADDDVESILDRVLDHMKHDYQVKEGSMASAEHHASGARFGGYWKGSDKNPPRPGQGVGGMEECAETKSLEQKLRDRWEQTKREKGLSEAGANNPAPGGTSTPVAQPTNTTQPQSTAQPATAQDAQKIKQNLQSLKSKVPGLDVNKTTQALTTADADQQLSTQDQQALSKSLASPIADIAKNPQLAGQLTQLINKGQQMSAQQKQQGGTQ